jgi:hypothetical protein
MRWLTDIIHSELGENSLGALRHIEQIYVAISYMLQFLGDHISGCVGPPDIVDLDSHAVAEYVAPDLGLEGRAGVEHTVANLILHARRFLEENQTPPATEMTRLREEIGNVLKWKMSRLAPKLPCGMSYVVRGTIDVNLTVECVSDESESVA